MASSSMSNSNSNSNKHELERYVKDLLDPILMRPHFPDADEWDGAVARLMSHHTLTYASADETTTRDSFPLEHKLEQISREILVNAYEKFKGPSSAPVMEVEMPYAVLARANDQAGAVRVVTAFLDSHKNDPSMKLHKAFQSKQRRNMALARMHCLRAAALDRIGAHRAALQDCTDASAALANVTRSQGGMNDALLLEIENTVTQIAAAQRLGAGHAATTSKMDAVLLKAIDTYDKAGIVAAREAVERHRRTLHNVQRDWSVYSSPVFSKPTDLSYIAKRRTCPGSVLHLFEHLVVLSHAGLYARVASECERWACEAVRLDDAFDGSIASRHPYPKALRAPAAFLRRNRFDNLSRTSTDVALRSDEVGEAVLRIPVEVLPYYLMALWMEDRRGETRAAIAALHIHGITIPLSDGTTDLVAQVLPTETDKALLPFHLLSLGSTSSCFRQVKDVILALKSRGDNNNNNKDEVVSHDNEPTGGHSEPDSGSVGKPVGPTPLTATARAGKEVPSKPNANKREDQDVSGRIRRGAIRSRDGTVLRYTTARP